MSLQGKTIILGVCGGIAAYKTPDLVSGLRKLGAEVHVLLTENAKSFVSPLSLEVMSGNKILSLNLDPEDPSYIPHIKYAQIADLILVAPATANAIAKMTMGLSDEILFDTILATQAPIIVAPAMNSNMWTHPTVRRNLEVLISMNYEIIEPDSGELACGTQGVGRLPEIETIIKRTKKAIISSKKSQGKGLNTLAAKEEISFEEPEIKSESFFSKVFSFNKQQKPTQNFSEIIHQANSALLGKKVVITMGATREKIDAVRYITNHSSGKMGLALVKEALNRGMQVDLISTIPINEDWVDRVNLISVESHEQMYNAVQERFLGADENNPASALIMVAAVADFKPVYASDQKIKKDHHGQNLVFELEQTSDILAEIAIQKKDFQIAIGFSVETEDPIQNAHRKVSVKNLDFIVANSPSAFGADFADVSFVFSEKYRGLLDIEQSFGSISKQVIAINIFDNLEKLI